MIKLGQNPCGAKVYAESDSDGEFWVEIESQYCNNIGICGRGRVPRLSQEQMASVAPEEKYYFYNHKGAADGCDDGDV